MERLAARLQLGGGGGSTIGRCSGSGSSRRPSMVSVKESALEGEAAAAAATDAAAAAAVAPPAVGGSVRRATVGSQPSVRRRSTISRASMDRPTSIATHPAHAEAAFCRSTFNVARLAMAADYRASRDGEVSPSEASPGEIQPAPTPSGVDQARLPLDSARPLSSPPTEVGGSSGGYAVTARPQDTTHTLSADQVLLQRPYGLPYGRPYGANATGGYAAGTTTVQLPASAPMPVARSARRMSEPFVRPITDSGMPHSRLQYVSTNDSPPPSMGSLTGAGFTVGGFGGGSSFSSGAGFSPAAGSPAAGNGRWGGGVGDGGGGGRRSRGSVSRHSAGSFAGLRPGVMEHALAQRGGPSPPMVQPRPCTPDKVHTVVSRGFVLRVLRSGALVQPRPFTLDKMRTLELSNVGIVEAGLICRQLVWTAGGV